MSGTAPRRYLPDPDRISEEWQQGKMPDIMTTVPFLRDTAEATFDRVEVLNTEGLPVKVLQEYVFMRLMASHSARELTSCIGLATRGGLPVRMSTFGLGE